jgi:L-aspartate oxidase
MPGVAPFLISEAVRGEGGILRNAQGHAFMAEHHPQADLAPRDVVARAILAQMEATGADHVFLDVTHVAPSRITSRFPQIYRFCLDHSLDITREPIPVSPAAHYMMGGPSGRDEHPPPLRLQRGRLHRRRRQSPGSNSLLETVVFGGRVAGALQPEPSATEAPAPPAGSPSPVARRWIWGRCKLMGERWASC